MCYWQLLGLRGGEASLFHFVKLNSISGIFIHQGGQHKVKFGNLSLQIIKNLNTVVFVHSLLFFGEDHFLLIEEFSHKMIVIYIREMKATY